jgi:cytochrome c5
MTQNTTHQWDRDKERHISAHEAKDGIEKIERVCKLCGATKKTFMPKGEDAWAEWRLADGTRFPGAAPCRDGGKRAELREAQP